MTLEDLEHIFKPQIDEGTTNLYYMLDDSGYIVIERHQSTELPALLPMLDAFQYAGSEGRIPRFIK